MKSKKRSSFLVATLVVLGILVGCPAGEPEIDVSLISISSPDPTGVVTVTGEAGAVTKGTPPIEFTITNLNTGAFIIGEVAEDGGFFGDLSGSVGDALRIMVEDAAGLCAWADLGEVPGPEDITPPIIKILSPYDCGRFSWDDTIQVEYEVTDPESMIDHVFSSIDSTTHVESGDSLPAKSTNYGNHIISVTAVNSAGLMATAYHSFKVELLGDEVGHIIDEFLADGKIDNHGIAASLKSKITNEHRMEVEKDYYGALGVLNAMQNFIAAQVRQFGTGETDGIKVNKHISYDAYVFLYLWGMYRESEISTQLEVHMIEYPETIQFSTKYGKIRIILPPWSGGGVFETNLGKGDFNILFEETPDPRIIELTEENPQVDVDPFEINGHSVSVKSVADPSHIGVGSIDLQTGLWLEQASTAFLLEIDGMEYGPFTVQTVSVGAVQFPYLRVADIHTVATGKVPIGVPFLGGANFMLEEMENNPWIESAKWTAEKKTKKVKGREVTCFEITITVKLTECANKVTRACRPEFEVCPYKIPPYGETGMEQGGWISGSRDYNYDECTLTIKWNMHWVDKTKPPLVNIRVKVGDEQRWPQANDLSKGSGDIPPPPKED